MLGIRTACLVLEIILGLCFIPPVYVIDLLHTYPLRNQSVYYYYHLLASGILIICIFVLVVYLLSTVYSQSRLIQSNCQNLC